VTVRFLIRQDLTLQPSQAIENFEQFAYVAIIVSLLCWSFRIIAILIVQASDIRKVDFILWLTKSENLSSKVAALLDSDSEETVSRPPTPTEMTEPPRAEPTLAGVMNLTVKMLQKVEDNKWDDREMARGKKWKNQDRIDKLEKIKEMDWLLEKIPTMSETADVDFYLQSLESELQQMGAPYEWWKTVLTPRLPPSLWGHIGDLQPEPETTYDVLKCRLLKRAGQTALRAGQQFFELSNNELKGKS